MPDVPRPRSPRSRPRSGGRAAILLIAVLLLWGGTGVAAQASPAVPAVDPDPATVDVNAVAKQMFTEINRVRTNPAELAQRLTTMRKGNTPADGGLVRVTFPDTTTDVADLGYLDSGIAKAQGLKPMGALVWSETLATVARTYANTNPSGHGNVAGRLDAAGANSGSAESIDYGAATGLKSVYRLYIDSRTPSLGHRNMMINSALTHVGVGCFRLNSSKNVTCVVDYATDWVDKADTARLEVGKQYAYRDAGGKFRYLKLTQLRGTDYRLDLCPEPSMGWLTGSSTGPITTGAAALAAGLTPSNQPCDTKTTPDGVLQNGTPFPGGSAAAVTKVTAGAATTSATATQNVSKPVVSSTAAPVVGQVGLQYAYIDTPGTFRYFKLRQSQGGGTIYNLDLCPNPGSMGSLKASGPTNSKLLRVSDALAQGLKPTTQPCDTKSVPNA